MKTKKTCHNSCNFPECTLEGCMIKAHDSWIKKEENRVLKQIQSDLENLVYGYKKDKSNDSN
jgi:hypothetical protein